MANRLGMIIYRHRWLTLACAGVFLLLSLGLLWRGGDLTSGAIHGLESERATHLVEQVVGHPLDTTFVAIFTSPTLDPEDAAFQAALVAALAPLRGDSAVAQITTAEDAPPALALQLANAHGALAYITLKGDFREGLKRYPGVRSRLRSDSLGINCTGKLPYFNDLNHTLEHDLLWAEVVSLPLALLVLLLVFRTLVAALLPVAVGALAVVGGVGIVTALSVTLDIAQYTLNVCSLIGLGVAIDYSLFTVSRYREELAEGHDYPEALARAMSHAGRVVIFSGVAVGAGLSGLLFFPQSYLWAMGLGGAIVVALAVVFALTLLPALLAVLGPRIHAGRLPSFGPGRGPRGVTFWHLLAQWVMRRPVAVLVPTLGALLLMGIPFFHLRLAASDARVLGRNVEARRGFELLRDQFPEQGQNRLLLAVEFPTAPALTTERIEALWDLSERLRRLPHVTKVESAVSDLPVSGRGAVARFLLDPPALAKDGIEAAERLTVRDRVALLAVTTDASSDSRDSEAVVQAARAERHVGDGLLWVGGQSAEDVDSTRFILAHAPAAVGFVVGVTALILFFLLGSVLLPIKAMAMNLVSIAGSFGALVWIFQDGHFGIRDPRPLEPALPVLLFCVLFGLSMDYEVLMLSRIRESYERTHDNTLSVADGLARTAGLITSAAAIMVAVFSAFSLASVVLVQAVGVGMALAVALDATLVRVLLVPATMRLFGDANWWAPQWLLRVRRFFGAEKLTD